MEGRSFQPPTAKQTKIIWLSLSAFMLALFLAIVGLVIWGIGLLLQTLTPVLLPLAIAGILAYLLDPVVDYLGRKGLSRTWSIFAVFFLAIALLLGGVGMVVPRLVTEVKKLVEQVPAYSEKIAAEVNEWLWQSPLVVAVDERSAAVPEDDAAAGEDLPEEEFIGPPLPPRQAFPWAATFRAAWTSDLRETIQGWAASAVPVISNWVANQASKIASWVGLLIGAALIPVYLFYLLVEKQGIKSSWTDYLPIHESRIKEEVVFLISSINDYLILFFRGQVLVALADGLMLTAGFMIIGLDFAFLLGMVAGLLSIVPYLGVVVSLVPALILAVVQFGDWLHPMMVMGLFALVQFLEGFFIAPKIMGDRVGLHPLTIILAVMIGTTLMGGIIGGILAIPLTAALRVVMFRYVWFTRKPVLPPGTNGGEETPAPAG